MLVKVLALWFCLSVTASQRVPFYRRDYTYVDQFDAFYKLHYDPAGSSWSTAFMACDDERSTLFYPKTKDEWTVVKNLLTSMNAKSNITEVLVGIHDETGMGEFVTVEGLPTPLPLTDDYHPTGINACIVMDIESGTYSLDSCESDMTRAFVCKRVKLLLASCPTTDDQYTIFRETNKCYKINWRQKSWNDAKHTCFMEGGHLAVITSKAEASTIRSTLPDGEYFVGFRRLLPSGDYYTAKGQDFNSNFYQNWWTSRREDDTKLDCGVARVAGGYDKLYISTRACESPAPFICEILAV